ncbi:MAG: glycosyltransferase [Eubacteriales bacterium]|nr:glycosyltransferase [Eubacteriales bacterium]
MKYKIDVYKLRDSNINIEGWALPKDLNEKPTFLIHNQKGEIVDFELNYTIREDLVEIFNLNKEREARYGFSVVFPYKEEETYTFEIIFDNNKRKTKLSKDIILKYNSIDYKKKKFFKSFLTIDNLKNAYSFLIKEGPSNFIKKFKSKLKGESFEYDYDEWARITKIKKEELQKQKEINFEYKPLFSIVIPIYDTNENFLRLLLNSIYNQTYTNFEICISDATDYKNSKNNPKKILEEYKNKYNNIIIKYLNKNEGIATNSNEAISLSNGEFIVLCDHDDELCENALFECVKALNEEKNIQIIYSDEDKIDLESETYFEPHFKPDFNLDFLLSVNYFCHLFVVKKELLEKIKKDFNIYERKEYDGAQDYDLFLRLINQILKDGDIINHQELKKALYTSTKIKHIPMVLYHWRCHKESTAKKPEAKMYAYSAGKKALEDFYKNTCLNFLPIKEIQDGVSLGFYHTIFDTTNNEDLITIVIPNKDHHEDLKICIDSINSGTYKNIKFLIIENNSLNNDTFKFYEKIQKENKNIKVIKWENDFNYALINNFGVKEVQSEYILFLNNDIKMINKDSIKEMYSYIKREDVGIVGAKLLYSDDTIQHAGVVIGFGGIAGHTFISTYDKENAYMHRNNAICDYSAITAACMLTKKSLFNKVNGFNKDFKVAFNDIDYCMKIRSLGKRVVYNPYASFYHYESKTRGLEDTKEKVERFNREIVLFGSRWPDILQKGDPYYNPNLTLRKSNFSLRDLHYEKIGEPYKLEFDIEKQIKEVKKFQNEKSFGYNSQLQ